MTLEFTPPYQLVNPQVRKDQQAQQFNQTLQNAGEMLLQNRQYNRQNSIQEALLALQKEKRGEEHADWVNQTSGTLPGFGDPNASGGYGGGTPSMAPSPSGSLQQGTTGPQPNYSMESGQDAFIPQGSYTPQPTDHTADFMHWKQTGVHPAYAGQQNPMNGFDINSIARIPGSNNRAEALGFLKDRQASDLQASEIAKNNAMAKMYGQGGPNAGLTYRQDPFTGQWMALPTKPGMVMPASVSGGAPGVGMGQGGGMGAGLTYQEKAKREMEKPKAAGALQNTLREYDNMINEANAIKNDPSVGTATGMTSFTQSIPGTGSKRVAARLNTLKAKTLLNVLGSLKELSANGSSGFGQLSELEGENIRNSVSTLDPRQSTQDFQAGIDRFIREMQQRKQTLQNTFTQTYGDSGQQSGMPQQQGQPNQGGGGWSYVGKVGQ